MSTKINKKNLRKEAKKISWDSFIEEFLSEDDKNKEIDQEKIDESGYWGQGHGSGAESFLGTYYGFGGDMQLATKLNPSVARIKKQEDNEIAKNMEDQQKINGGYPAPESSSGFAGGDGLGGPNSGVKYPNNIAQIGKSSKELDNLYGDDPYKNYWGPPGDNVPLDVDLTSGEDEERLSEQCGTMRGPQRGAASDQNYRDLPGNNRPNKLEKPIRFLPQVEGDQDHNGEEDEYLENDEYVNDVLRLNGINEPTKKVMKNLGIQNNVANESRFSIKKIFFEDWYDAPKTGTERYKQGRNLDTAEISMDPTKAIMGYKDHSQGHAGDDPAETSPGGMAYGVVIAPKGFVPEDWEQRSNMTKEDDFDKTQLANEHKIQNMINDIVKEELISYFKENYTGIEDKTGKGESKGGSSAFEKNKKEVLSIDDKEKKNLTVKSRK